MVVKRSRTIYAGEGHPLFPYCQSITSLANNLSNAVRFRQRQAVTAAGKDEKDLTKNEREVLRELKQFGKRSISKGDSPYISYTAMWRLMQDSRNPDYYAKGLPAQSAQWVVRQAVTDFGSYYAALAAYRKDPSKFKEKPGIPGYKKKGGHCMVTITNQDCTVTEGPDGMCYAKFPFAKKTPLCIGMPGGRLKEAKIVPDNGKYRILFVFDVEMPDASPAEEPGRIAAIDFGVDNLMAVTNNCGLPCLLYKGGIVKSENRLYNKKLASIMEKEMKKPGCPVNRDGKPKFVPTEESMALALKRGCRIKDFMRKTACHFITWCVGNRIDTIVLGVNRQWKQNSCIGTVNNQNFVQVPFQYLRSVIKYKAQEHGICCVEQEESYTSKASFLDGDYIPVYGKDDGKASFSGKRRPTRYKGMYKKDGFRGLYKAKGGTIINADLNGSANILRKAFPDAFQTGVMPGFSKANIIRNPDLEHICVNRKTQPRPAHTAISKSKAARIRKKLAA